MSKKIRVMLIEDSVVVQEMLKHIIDIDGRFEVVAVEGSAEGAIARMGQIRPDVISMDIRLPGMNGLEATLKIMMEYPTPIVVVSDNIQSEDLKISIHALQAGALSVVEKPVGLSHADYGKVARRICDQLAAMSTVKVVRQRILRNLSFLPRVPPVSNTPVYATRLPFSILGLVASTGGPQALLQILQGLPKEFPLPIAIVQHITPSFLDSFVSWLGSITAFKAQIALPGEVPRPGIIYLPPVDRHLGMNGKVWTLLDSPPLSSQKPSGTILFQGMAKSLGPAGLGVLLTGMGDDGAQGLLDLKKSGGYTITEDESTAVVYGMPAVGKAIGGSCESLPLDRIAPRLLDLISEQKEARCL